MGALDGTTSVLDGSIHRRNPSEDRMALHRLSFAGLVFAVMAMFGTLLFADVPSRSITGVPAEASAASLGGASPTTVLSSRAFYRINDALTAQMNRVRHGNAFIAPGFRTQVRTIAANSPTPVRDTMLRQRERGRRN